MRSRNNFFRGVALAFAATRLAAMEITPDYVVKFTPENAILGYVTDVDDIQPLASAMLFSAQYTLAPRLLQKGAASRDLVLGNFTKPADFAAFGQQRGLKLERDFGNGVILFRKEAHQ